MKEFCTVACLPHTKSTRSTCSLENKLRAYDSPGDLSERKSSCDLRERESKAMNLVGSLPDQLRGGGPLNWESTGVLSDIESILGGDS